jgi:aspartate aminotransferase/aminotransferase
MSFIATRMSCIDASGIRKVFALAANMKNPINLSIGQPDYDVDEVVKEAAIQKIREGANSYTQTWGIDALREGCSDYYQDRFGFPLSNTMITSGVSGGLFLALMACVNTGDEVLFGDPYFVMYKHLVNVLGGTSVPVSTYPDFKLKADAVEAAITEKTKILILNSPSNPTGATQDREELEALAAVAKRHGLLVITDEIYERLQYEGEPVSIGGMHDDTIVLNGFSKMAAMTGWRVGFAAGPEEVIDQMNTLQQYSFVCAPSFAQHAALVALTEDTSDKVEAYREKRDILYEGLQENFSVEKPTGAFYIFPEAPGGDGEAFVAKAIENNVLIIPGSVFSEQNTHIRISFAAPNDTLRSGLEVLNRLAAEM